MYFYKFISQENNQQTTPLLTLWDLGVKYNPGI